jgi:two-component sensor histidine kinase/putative methionine-R-sulfoxide reductase with GAF domain
MPTERLMHHIAAQVARVTHISRTKIMRYRPEHGDLLIEAGVGWNADVVGHVVLAADHRSPAGRAYQTALPVSIYDASREPDYRLPAVLRDHGIVSLLNVPVMVNGFTWGVLEADSTEPHAFDEWDVGFLSTIANLMGVCLALHENRRQKMEGAAQRAREQSQFDRVIRELQHRIKNNLQIIVAFLSMKTRDLSGEGREVLNTAVGRVQAIALAHDLLSVKKEPGAVDLGDYIGSLCANIDPQRPNVTIEVSADPVSVPIDRAVPAGLIANELVTNSIKYAFGNGVGHIHVSIKVINHRSEICLTVEDDGKGMEMPPKKGRGLSLIEGFAHQIQGRLEFARVESGTRIVLCFPVAL